MDPTVWSSNPVWFQLVFIESLKEIFDICSKFIRVAYFQFCEPKRKASLFCMHLALTMVNSEMNSNLWRSLDFSHMTNERTRWIWFIFHGSAPYYLAMRIHPSSQLPMKAFFKHLMQFASCFTFMLWKALDSDGLKRNMRCMSCVHFLLLPFQAPFSWKIGNHRF